MDLEAESYKRMWLDLESRLKSLREMLTETAFESSGYDRFVHLMHVVRRAEGKLE